jgi:crossover junction endodeoxyribonuclease RuvC
MYVLSLDLSLANSGGCIFTKDGKPVTLFSIPTSSRLEQKDRLRIIGDYLQKIKDKYDIQTLVLENGFARFNISTQALFKVAGMVCYIFSDIEQFYYAPSSIKKVVAGNGRASKEDVEKSVMKYYPHLSIGNNDESDSVAVGLCHFIKKGIV